MRRGRPRRPRRPRDGGGRRRRRNGGVLSIRVGQTGALEKGFSAMRMRLKYLSIS